MESRLSITDKEFLASINTGRSQEEIFNSIAQDIKNSHHEEITEHESKQLARNFI